MMAMLYHRYYRQGLETNHVRAYALNIILRAIHVAVVNTYNVQFWRDCRSEETSLADFTLALRAEYQRERGELHGKLLNSL